MHDCRGLQNPYWCHWSDEFQKKIRTFFFRKIILPGFWGTWLPSSTLIDLLNTALVSRDSVKTICMIWEGCRTQRVVTGPMNFKKRRFFFGKSCSRDLGAPGCHPRTLICFANTAVASKASVETICLFWEGWRTHSVVTGPMNFKKIRTFFFRKIMLPGFWATWLPSRHVN